MRVVPGCGFTLEGHANSAFNQEWLVVRVEHSGKQTGSLDEEAGEEGNRYENTLFLIPHNKPWRSPLKPRPIIRGTQVAHVTGPEGESSYYRIVRPPNLVPRAPNKSCAHQSCLIYPKEIAV